MADINFDFTTGSLPGAITFTRASIGTYLNNVGTLITATANTPRFNYVSGVANLLIEPAATNLLIRSNAFTTTWFALNAGVATAAQFVSPDGTNNGWSLTSGSGFGGDAQAITFSAVPYTMSVWAKLITGSFAMKLQLQTVQSGSLTITSTIARISATLTPPAGGASAYIINSAASGNTSGIYGAQLETGSVMTSYIPTTTAAVTRVADSATFTIPSGVTQLTYTFDDNSTQIVSVSAGSYTIPTNLNRPNIKTIYGPEVAGPKVYYVSTTGSDANSGLTTALPWAHAPGMTGATGVAASTALLPGDSVLLKCGDSWLNTTLTVNAGGTAGNQITLGSYSTGAKPIISATAAPDNPAITAVAASRDYWTIDGLDLRASGIASGILVPTAIYHNNWVSSKIQVRNWIIQNCISNAAFYLGGPNTIVRSCILNGLSNSKPPWGGVIVRTDVATDCLVEYCDISNFTDRGIWFFESADRGTVRYNKVHDIVGGTDNPGTCINMDGFTTSVVDSLVYGNECYSSPRGIEFENGTRGKAYYNSVHDCTISGISVINYGALVTQPSNIEITYNLIYNTNIGINLNYVQTIKFIGNTIANGTGASPQGFCIQSVDTDVSGITFTNNIIGGAWTNPIRAQTAKNVWTQFNYNDIVPASGGLIYFQFGTGTNWTLAQVQSNLGAMTNGITTDPQFTGGTDFSIATTSPANATGLDLGATYQTALLATTVWTSSINTGTQVTGQWDMGAYLAARAATTFYVSTTGSDANSGATTALPWAHAPGMTGVTGVPASTALLPGDIILLKRGDSWLNTTMTMNAGGALGQQITLGAYGTGANPIITAVANNPCLTVTVANRGYWTIDGLDLRASGLITGINLPATIYHNYWAADMLPVPSWIIQNCVSNASIYLSGPNTTVRGNVLDGTANSNPPFGGIIFRSANNYQGLIELNEVSHFKDRGIWLFNAANDAVVRYNHVHDIVTGTDNEGMGINFDGFAIAVTNGQAYGNWVHNCAGIGITYENGIGGRCYYNLIHDCVQAGVDVINYAAYQPLPSNIEFNYNVIYNTNVGIMILDAQGVKAIGNTIYQGTGANSFAFGIWTLETYVQDLTFVNNIVGGVWTHPIQVRTSKDVWDVFDYNDIVPTAGGEVVYQAGTTVSQTLAQIQALGLMTHGITANPLFVTPGSNFSLQSGSPAKGTGTNLGVSYNQALLPTTVWPTAINLGTQAGAWNMGAYLQPEPVIPPIGPTEGNVAWIQSGGKGELKVADLNKSRITTVTSATLKGTPGQFYGCLIGAMVANGVIEVYDALTVTGTPVLVLTSPATLTQSQGVIALPHPIRMAIGITVRTLTAAQDVTMLWN